MGGKSRNFCRVPFKGVEISTLPCECIFSLINFITNNEHFHTNAEIHSENTSHRLCLLKSTANLLCFQKIVCDAGIKIFNNLPSDLKSLMDERARFKMALKR
jgi:hypothetical protein